MTWMTLVSTKSKQQVCLTKKCYQPQANHQVITIFQPNPRHFLFIPAGSPPKKNGACSRVALCCSTCRRRLASIWSLRHWDLHHAKEIKRAMSHPCKESKRNQFSCFLPFSTCRCFNLLIIWVKDSSLSRLSSCCACFLRATSDCYASFRPAIPLQLLWTVNPLL